MDTLVFATNNKHKLDEVTAILKNSVAIAGLSEIGCHTNIPETGHSLQENALQKALFVYDNYHCNCFADDTGLEVEALNEEPGVYSARYAGEPVNFEANIDKLLDNLRGITNRKARFRTIVALIMDNHNFFFEGIINGYILTERKGHNGFGYDSVFVPDRYNETFAELSADIKNTVSHRAKAINQLCQFLINKSNNTIK
ncbi:MAG: non-canonical purine NTP diphosphatase [Sphingobacteriia bacterium]|jgi:XTP/dITP diphosphohydrolase|nr:non-canonical purine NTP diphosphatase [Paludibacteraceae bacterium]NCA79370.1 non-canonical purine NTP diphosphatase [Sphingobacteriia bacterium]